MDDLDSAIFDEIKKLALDPTCFEAEPAKTNDLELINNKINQLDDQMSKLMDLYSIGNMPVKMLQEKIKDLDDQKNELMNDAESLKDTRMTKHDAVAMAQTMLAELDGYTYDEEGNAVDEDGKIIVLESEEGDIELTAETVAQLRETAEAALSGEEAPEGGNE